MTERTENTALNRGETGRTYNADNLLCRKSKSVETNSGDTIRKQRFFPGRKNTGKQRAERLGSVAKLGGMLDAIGEIRNQKMRS